MHKFPLAAVDLGSNSFHMIIAELRNDRLIIIDRIREMVQLGAGLDDDGNLSEASRLRAEACLARFGERLKAIPPRNIRAVGTNTLRQVRDSRLLLRGFEQALGHGISIISGDEEARLIYLGVSRSLGFDEEPRLVMDIGGGSTECILGRRFESLFRSSIGIGCVNISRQFFADGRITRKRMGKAILEASRQMEDVAARTKQRPWVEAVGASGTIRTICKWVNGEAWTPASIISAEAMQRLQQCLVDAGHIEALAGAGIDPERAQVLPGGFAVLQALFDNFAIESMRVSDEALREGLLHDMLGRIHHRDVREATVAKLARQYTADADQATRVKTLACQLFDAVAGKWELPESGRAILGWAADLHETGLVISHRHHHRHGAYIIRNSDLAGFTQDEQELLADLIQLQRKKIDRTVIDNWEEENRLTLFRLMTLFRLAVQLQRGREEPMSPAAIDAGKRRLALAFGAGWLERHPLTTADLEREQGWLAAHDFRLTFE